jgi:hypothetical protein
MNDKLTLEQPESIYGYRITNGDGEEIEIRITDPDSIIENKYPREKIREFWCEGVGFDGYDKSFAVSLTNPAKGDTVDFYLSADVPVYGDEGEAVGYELESVDVQSVEVIETESESEQ